MSAKSLLIWHRRIALALAPVLLAQALTGLVLLWPAGDGPVHPGPIHPSQAAAPSALIAAAQAAAPGFHAFRLDYPETPGARVTVRLRDASGDRRFALVDAVDAHVADIGPLSHYPRRMAQEWHNGLMAAAPGSIVVLALGLGLMALVVTGLKFWWPGAGHVRRGLSIPARTPARLKLRLWHRSVGVVVSALVLLLAGTGIGLVWPSAFPAGSAPSPAPAMPVDAAVALAQRVLPGQPLRDIRIDGAGHVTIHLAAISANHWDLDTVIPDGATPRIIRAADAPALWMRLLPLHTGDALGPWGEAMAALLALSLIFLATSGVIAWNRARAAKKRPTKGQSRP